MLKINATDKGRATLDGSPPNPDNLMNEPTGSTKRFIPVTKLRK